MRKSTLGLATTVLTFLVGLVAVSLVPHHRPGSVEQAPPPAPVVAYSGSIPPALRKVDIGRRFSVYLPPGMEYSSPPQGGGLYTGAGYRFYYEYGRRLSDSLCDDLPASMNRGASRSGRRMVVGGKAAWLDDAAAVEDYTALGAHDWPSMRLCVPDMGDGTRLFIEVQAPYSRRLNEARPMIDSIEFR